MSTLIPRPRYPEGTSPRTGLSRYTSRTHLTGHAPIAQFHLAHRPYRGKIRKAPLPKDHEIIMFGRNEQSMIRGRRLASPRGLGEGATLRAAAKPGVSVAIISMCSLTFSLTCGSVRPGGGHHNIHEGGKGAVCNEAAGEQFHMQHKIRVCFMEESRSGYDGARRQGVGTS